MGRGTDHFLRWRYDSWALAGFVLVCGGLAFGVVSLFFPDEGTAPWPMGVGALVVAAAGGLLCVRRWRAVSMSSDEARDRAIRRRRAERRN